MTWLLLGSLLASAPGFDSRALSSSPDAAASSMTRRGASRGTVSVEVPFVDLEHFWFALIPLIELHNLAGSSSIAPHQFWRARFTLWGEWRTSRFALGLGLEHESDHATVRSPQFPYGSDFLAINDIAVRGALLWSFGGFTLETALSVQGYVLTCTDLNGYFRQQKAAPFGVSLRWSR